MNIECIDAKNIFINQPEPNKGALLTLRQFYLPPDVIVVIGF